MLARGNAHERAGLETEGLNDSVLLISQELGHAACQLALFVHLEPEGLGTRLHLNIGAELVDLLSREVAVMDHDRLDGVAGGEGAELGAFDQLGHVLKNQVDAEIRLVGAVGLHGLKVGDAPEGSGRSDIIRAELGENRGQHVLEHGEHVVLGGEGHLHVELVELAGGAVAAGVLVSKAGGDLEVAVKSGCH